MSRVIVIGGGAAGMMAAAAAAGKGHSVLLLEKNEKLGKKIYITGKGRCNLTNACDVQELFDSVVSNPRFLYSAIYGFDNTAVQDFFEKRFDRKSSPFSPKFLYHEEEKENETGTEN